MEFWWESYAGFRQQKRGSNTTCDHLKICFPACLENNAAKWKKLMDFFTYKEFTPNDDNKELVRRICDSIASDAKTSPCRIEVIMKLFVVALFYSANLGEEIDVESVNKALPGRTFFEDAAKDLAALTNFSKGLDFERTECAFVGTDKGPKGYTPVLLSFSNDGKKIIQYTVDFVKAAGTSTKMAKRIRFSVVHCLKKLLMVSSAVNLLIVVGVE